MLTPLPPVRTHVSSRFSGVLDPQDPALAKIKDQHDKQRNMSNGRQMVEKRKTGFGGWLKKFSPFLLLSAAIGLSGYGVSKQLEIRQTEAQVASESINKNMDKTVGAEVNKLLADNQPGTAQSYNLTSQDIHRANSEVENIIRALKTQLAEGSNTQTLAEKLNPAIFRTVTDADRTVAKELAAAINQQQTAAPGQKIDFTEFIQSNKAFSTLSDSAKTQLAKSLSDSFNAQSAIQETALAHLATVDSIKSVETGLLQYLNAQRTAGKSLNVLEYLNKTDAFSIFSNREKEQMANEIYRSYNSNPAIQPGKLADGVLKNHFETALANDIKWFVHNQQMTMQRTENGVNMRKIIDASPAFAQLNDRQKESLANELYAFVKDNNAVDGANLTNPLSAYLDANYLGLDYNAIRSVHTRADALKLLDKAFKDPKNLTNFTGEERDALVRNTHQMFDQLGHEYTIMPADSLKTLTLVMLVIGGLGTVGFGIGTSLQIKEALKAAQKKRETLAEQNTLIVANTMTSSPETDRIVAKVRQHCTELADLRKQVAEKGHEDVKALLNTFESTYRGWYDRRAQRYDTTQHDADVLSKHYENQAQLMLIKEGKRTVTQEQYYQAVEKVIDQAKANNDYLPELPAQPMITLDQLNTDDLAKALDNKESQIQMDIDHVNANLASSELRYVNQRITEFKGSQEVAQQAQVVKQLESNKAADTQQVELEKLKLTSAEKRLAKLKEASEEAKKMLDDLQEQRFRYQVMWLKHTDSEAFQDVMTQLQTMRQTHNRVTTSQRLTNLLDEAKAKEILMDVRAEEVSRIKPTVKASKPNN